MSSAYCSELCLHVISASCKCGNKWTHSHLWLSGGGVLGGTPTPFQEEQNPVTSIAESTYHYSNCFRCVGLHIGIGWQKPAPLEHSTIGAPLTPRSRRATTPRAPINIDEVFDEQ